MDLLLPSGASHGALFADVRNHQRNGNEYLFSNWAFLLASTAVSENKRDGAPVSAAK